MRGLKYGLGLAVAILLHVAAIRFFDDLFRVVDLFLIVTLLNAVGAGLMGGMVGGLAAGLVTDTLSGGLYGLYGFADTIVGYGAAFAAQRLVIQRATAVWLVFSVAAAVQQTVIMGLSQLLLPDPALPAFVPVAIKVASTGLIGAVAHLGRRRLRSALGLWRKSRTSRLR